MYSRIPCLSVKAVLVLGLCVFASACNRSTGPSSSSSTLDIVFTSSDVMSATRGSHRACSVTYESTTVNGRCYTPLSVKGIFNMATLGSTGGGGAGARLLGGGTLSGLEAVFHTGAFDLATSPSIDGDDNIQDSSGGPFNYISLDIQAIEYSFLGEAGDRVYHVRIPFAQTVPSESSVYSSCGLGGGLTEADTYGSLYGTFSANAGDILVCIKSTDTETCENTDFQWVNGSSLTSTRPGSPKAVSGTYLLTADACTMSGDMADITWGHSTLEMSLSSAVSVSAEITAGVKTYTVGASTGTGLTATIDVDLTDALFVPDSAINSALNTQTESQILGQIDEVLLKPMFVNKHKSTPASNDDGMMDASVTLTVN